MDAREGPLTRAFVRLADTLVADYDAIELCQQLVDDCVELLHATAAGLLLGDHHDSLRVLASTSEQTRLMELFQLQADAGPCLDAYHTGNQVVVDDLTAARAARWPVFGDRMLAEGFRAVYAVPLRLREQRIGALNLFCTQVGALSPEDVAVGQALADVATIGILHQRVSLGTRASTSNYRARSTAASSSNRPKVFSPNAVAWTWSRPSSCSVRTPATPTPVWPRPLAPSWTAPSTRRVYCRPPNPTPRVLPGSRRVAVTGRRRGDRRLRWAQVDVSRRPRDRSATPPARRGVEDLIGSKAEQCGPDLPRGPVRIVDRLGHSPQLPTGSVVWHHIP